MKKTFILSLISVSLVIFLSACIKNDKDSAPSSSSQTLAQTWIEQNAATYTFDGLNLAYKGAELDSSCPTCTNVIFTFTSRHGGYGWRDGEILTQSLVDHTIVIKIKDGEIISAVTDKRFDEINQTMVEK